MIKVISKFEATAIVPADSQGPYTVNAGSPVTLSAGVTHPDAAYHWGLGDGAQANTPTVIHTYADNGIYIAKLTVIVNQPGGAKSRHFAEIHAKNVPPKVNAGPDRTVNEGEMVTFTGTFNDPEWPDTHEATWDWGDYQKPDAGVVNETHNPPSANGTASGTHAWGDNGVYTVTLTVRDDDGGVGQDTLQVTVLNVPPVVEAGPDQYAYPCSVITLEGRFTDPGWLDTHVGTWAFGDCTPPQPAVTRESNEPPQAKGVAIASHTYQGCGTFHAICTVIDDDGGVGRDTTVIRVVDVINAGFEYGFRVRIPGSVANGWEPYAATIEEFAKPSLPLAPPANTFLSEEFVVHSGERSQSVHVHGRLRAGIWQQIGANPGWDYQITAWYSLAEQSGGLARLGIDPMGGTDPTAPTIVWSAGKETKNWDQLVVRATAAAKAKTITILLECLSAEEKSEEDESVAKLTDRAGAVAFFDDIALQAVQPFCPELPKETTKPERPKESCVSFDDVPPGTQFPPSFSKAGYTFHAMDGRPLEYAVWGVPVGRNKLSVRGGIFVDLPFPSERVQVKASQNTQFPITIEALDTNQKLMGRDAAPAVSGTLHTVEISSPGMARLAIHGGGGEGLLYEICARGESLGPRTHLAVRRVREEISPREGEIGHTDSAVTPVELSSIFTGTDVSYEYEDKTPAGESSRPGRR